MEIAKRLGIVLAIIGGYFAVAFIGSFVWGPLLGIGWFEQLVVGPVLTCCVLFIVFAAIIYPIMTTVYWIFTGEWLEWWDEWL